MFRQVQWGYATQHIPFNRELVLNPRHWAYHLLIAAVIPVGFNNRPLLIAGPRANNWPQNFSAGLVNTQVNADGPAFVFNNTAGQVIKTGNQSIFGGKEQMTAIAKWVAGSTRTDFQDICRKDGEWTPFQYGGAFDTTTNHIHGNIWGSGDAGAAKTCGNGLATISGGDVIEAAHATAVNLTTGGTDTFYLRKNYGSLTSENSAAHNTGNVSSNTGTPLCFGGNESGAELVISDQLNYCLFFDTKFTADQVMHMFHDPFGLFAEPEVSVMGAVAVAASPPTPVRHSLPLLGVGG